MATQKDVPTYDSLLNPTLSALRKLGGSATINELVDEIIAELGLPQEVVEVQHGRGNQTKLQYRAAWARTYLKKVGLVENSERGVWALTPEGMKTQGIDPREVVRAVRKMKDLGNGDDDDDNGSEDCGWRDQLIDVLLEIDPTAFERLCQRILRESGFIEVVVTKRSGDGGIDGYGVMRIGGIISFNVLFQSKRHRTNLGPDVVRDFRGAMVGRADKGLLITTGGFTREARKEATRDGAPPIDLIDGKSLAEKLKELRLGVAVKTVEEVEINAEWFRAI